jgi:hypothetical protein
MEIVNGSEQAVEEEEPGDLVLWTWEWPGVKK